MDKISRDQAVAALVEVMRDALAEGEEVLFPDLGTFRVEHEPSQPETLSSGETVIRPPRHAVLFTPED
ncbi:MAG TPA: HU family DNA-binding protein [Rhodothermales bacterium]|nr:HU family DNA-binding protein [Rhodothermales bacterium]